MQQIFNFIVRFKTGLTFLLLMLVSLYLTIEAHSYHQSKWVSSTNAVSGSLYEMQTGITTYLALKEENNKLTQENASLRNALLNSPFLADSLPAETVQDTSFITIPVKVIKNSYQLTDNYLLLNKGKKEGVKATMGVISSQGIVGIVEEVSQSYARVISILNSNISINAKLKKSNHFGSLVWQGGKPNLVKLIDVPRAAAIQVGDSIVTGGNSLIFPAHIPIGKVSEIELNDNQGYYDISVELFNDMTSLENVYVIHFTKQEEAQNLYNNKDSND